MKRVFKLLILIAFINSRDAQILSNAYADYRTSDGDSDSDKNGLTENSVKTTEYFRGEVGTKYSDKDDYATVLQNSIIEDEGKYDFKNNLHFLPTTENDFSPTYLSSSETTTTERSETTTTKGSETTTTEGIETTITENSETTATENSETTTEGSETTATENSETTTTEDSETTTTEHDCDQYDIKNVIINATQDTIEMSWDPNSPINPDQCKIKYDVNITSAKYDSFEIPYFRQELNTYHKFAGLRPCTAYNLSLQANEGNIFQKTVSTLPEKIGGLNVTVQQNRTAISWSPSENPHCSNYKILLHDRVEQTYQTKAVFSGQLYCKNISVVNMNNDNRDGEPNFITLPDQVQHLSIVPDANSLSISWQPPNDTSCVSRYQISLGEKTFSTNNTHLEIFSLEACTPYNVEVISISYTETSSSPARATASTTMPGQIAEVSNLRVTQVEDDYINATWGPPVSQGACITSYDLMLWNQDDTTQTEVSVNTTHYGFSSLVGCMTYTVQVKPRASGAEGNVKQDSTTVDAKPLKPPTHRTNITGKVWAQLTLGLDVYKDNMCNINQVDVKCEALMEDNDDLPWLVISKETSIQYNDNQSRPPAIVNVTGLSEFTNYTCYATANNTWGKSNESNAIVFQTLEDVPSEPRNLQITVLNSTSFKVTWEEPYKIPGIPTLYYFNIEEPKALHYIPDECRSPSETVNLEFDFGTTQFTFTDGLPNFRYLISLAASTKTGVGAAVENYTSTFTSASESPRNLQHTVINTEEHTYNATAILEWELPCNTNGNIKHFHMVIHGEMYPSESGTERNEENDDRIENIPVNEPIENISYTFDIVNVKGGYNYTVEIYAVSSAEEGERGKSKFTWFVTPEGFPSAPTITNIVPEEYFVTITWDPPGQHNGLLKHYTVSITTEGPLHFIPDTCEIVYQNHEYEVDIYEMSFIFQDGLPNFNYTATVTASTSIGPSSPSNAYSFQTFPIGSNPPRGLDYDLENILGDDYNVTATLAWLFPCNTNSFVSHFIVEIYGTSLDNAAGDQRNQSIEIITPTENLTFQFEILPLQNYTVLVYAFSPFNNDNMTGQSSEVTFFSPDGWPSAPIITDVNVKSDAVTLTWDEPLNKNGILQNFTIVINPVGPLHLVPDECNIDNETRTYVVEPTARTFEFLESSPNYNYTVTITAATRAGYGSASNPISFQTPESRPETIRNLTLYEVHLEETESFNATATMSFLKPCNLNGEFKFYEIGIHAVRVGFDDIDDVLTIDKVEDPVLVINLKPEFLYTINVTVLTKNFSSETSSLSSFMSPSGVPPVAIYNITSPLSNGSTQAVFTFSNNIFDNSSGTILYYSLILSEINDIGNVSGFGFWDGTEVTWPSVGYWTEIGTIVPYQVTPNRWNPFINRVSDFYTFVFGEENCIIMESSCNGPLRPNTLYALVVRGLTNRGFRNSRYATFITPSDLEPGLNLGLILGLIFGILAMVVLSIFIFILWRRRRKQNDNKTSLDPLIPTAVPVKEFPDYYVDIKQNLNKLKSEYTLLETKTAALSLSSDTAVLDENRKKNRYINILPYDESRVKLDTDKNANYSDYINASYIKGYSGNVEYIATQGPLESTVVDFWRMVMQENVAVVIMVAQFVENGKHKCHKYFPSNHENMEIGDGIEIRCSNELNFGSYTVRSLLVQRELNQWSITHLQFTDWPDFGCPIGTQPMLQFCNVIRSYIEKNKSKTVVHCSAGVGRTGTLIAVDILLQTIENNGAINVFKTVFNMRSQRSHMVQTEKQYMYIHTCIKDYILNPLKTEDNSSEPIYENVDILQTILNDKLVAESAL